MLLNLLNCCQSFVSTLVLILGIHGLSGWIKNPSSEFFMKEKNCIPRGLKASESWSLQGRRCIQFQPLRSRGAWSHRPQRLGLESGKCGHLTPSSSAFSLPCSRACARKFQRWQEGPPTVSVPQAIKSETWAAGRYQTPGGERSCKANWGNTFDRDGGWSNEQTPNQRQFG